MEDNEPTTVSIYNIAAELRLFDENHKLLVFAGLFSETGEINSSGDLLEKLFMEFSDEDEMTSDELLTDYLAALEDALIEAQGEPEVNKPTVTRVEERDSVSKTLLQDIRETAASLSEINPDHELLKFCSLTSVKEVMDSPDELIDQFAERFSPRGEEEGQTQDLFVEYHAKLEDAIAEEEMEKADA